MQRTQLNTLIDSTIFACFLLLVSTGALMYWVLPSGAGHFETIWGLDRHGWGAVHFWIALTMVLLIAIHLSLHWRWILAAIKGKPSRPSRRRIVVACTMLAGLLLLAAAPILSPVRSTDRGNVPHRGSLHAAEEPDLFAVDGTMTLQQVAARTGIPIATLRAELGLPGNAPADERIGRMRRHYDFELDAVRDAVRKHARM